MRMEAGEEKGGWETGFFFLIFTDIVKMGWDTKPQLDSTERRKKIARNFRQYKYITVSLIKRMEFIPKYQIN